MHGTQNCQDYLLHLQPTSCIRFGKQLFMKRLWVKENQGTLQTGTRCEKRELLKGSVIFITFLVCRSPYLAAATTGCGIQTYQRPSISTVSEVTKLIIK